MVKAIQGCKDGKMSMRAASTCFGVPFQTICLHLRKPILNPVGRPTLSPPEVETLLVELLN